MRWLWGMLIALALLAGCRAAPVESPAEKLPADLPGVRLNIEAGYVELEGHVSPRAGEWLELIACHGRSLEHESLVTVDALPSHVHLALLLLGAEPGRPQSWRAVEGGFEVDGAGGDALVVQFIVEGESEPIPAESWVVDQRTGEGMGAMRWVFAGSKFVEIQGRAVYAADVNGPVVTLVHFGDEVAAPAETEATNRTDEQQWNARADRVPPAGTPVRVRLSRPRKGSRRGSRSPRFGWRGVIGWG